MWLNISSMMISSGLSTMGIVLVAYVFAFTSLPFMGDEIETSPVVQIIASLVLLVLINLFSVWRFKKLNASFSGAASWKAALWIYQGLFVLLIAGANVLVGSVGVFYLMRVFTDPLA